MSAIAGPRPVARAEQVQPGDAPAAVGVGVGLLLDGEPAGTQPIGLEPEPPAQVQAASDLADGSLEELEVLGAAEPCRERAGRRLGASPLPEPARQQRPEPDISRERMPDPGEVLNRKAVKERSGDGELRNGSRRAAVR